MVTAVPHRHWFPHIPDDACASRLARGTLYKLPQFVRPGQEPDSTPARGIFRIQAERRLEGLRSEGFFRMSIGINVRALAPVGKPFHFWNV